MTNDNKTLADVQPGGRVRLGDQASAQGCDELRMRTDGERAAYLEGVAEGRRAVLSAQPSPGGQGDALLDQARKLFDELGAIADDDKCVAILAAALAARQPVYVQGCDELRARTEGERAAYMEGLEEGKKIAARQPVVIDLPESLHDRVEALREVAARQPVGEPVAYRSRYIERDGRRGVWMYHHEKPEYASDVELQPLYAAPPAQAVDLDALRRLSDGWLARSEKLSVTQQRKAGAYWACAKELRDWLDSQAVGNG